MSKYRNNARLAGALFILAMIASISGGFMLQEVIDTTNISNISDKKMMLILGVLLELINAFSVAGIALSMWQPLKLTNPTLSLGYIGVRFVSAALDIVTAFIPVTMLTIANLNLENRISNLNESQFFYNILYIIRHDLHSYTLPLCFSTGAVLLYIMLYRSGIVPKYIAVWGFIAVIGIGAANFLGLPLQINILLGIPIIINEIYLGVYLIIKGFVEPLG